MSMLQLVKRPLIFVVKLFAHNLKIYLKNSNKVFGFLFLSCTNKNSFTKFVVNLLSYVLNLLSFFEFKIFIFSSLFCFNIEKNPNFETKILKSKYQIFSKSQEAVLIRKTMSQANVHLILCNCIHKLFLQRKVLEVHKCQKDSGIPTSS